MKTLSTNMRTCASRRGKVYGFTALLLVLWAVTSLHAQTLYWDANSSTAGAGATPTGTWSTSNSSSTRRWSTSSAGTASTSRWTSGRDAVFSAGTDATNAFTVTISGTQNVSSIRVDEGTPTFSGGTALNFNDATPTLDIATGRTLIWSTGLNSTTGNLSINTVAGYNGTVNLTSNLSLSGTVRLDGGTLQLSGSNYTFGTLNVTANSVINLAGNTTLNLTNLSISAGVTLTIQNWQDTVDFVYTTNFTGATLDNRGTGAAAQVVFSGFTGADTIWQSYDHQVTPVPEPATYGAVLTGGLLAFAAWRRKCRTMV